MKTPWTQRALHAAQYAIEHGHVCVFITITLPSRFHPGCRRPGRAIPITPKDGYRWLHNIWDKTRADMVRRGIPMYGVRMVDQHPDGTPHWHVLACLPTQSGADVLQALMRRNMPAGDTGGRHVTATGYAPVAEGIAHYADKASDSRVQAWASIWGIRLGASFGLPGDVAGGAA
ncbi:replication endonuclease [Paracidovorax valerianellae]|uniref:replication endonuclease n=1 Tax=Paracidovorax valerianellae TaxID=187868 RepID=UPI00336A6B69